MILGLGFSFCAKCCFFKKICFLTLRILRNFALYANNFAQICAKLVACDAEQCGILRKSWSASNANDAQKFAKIIFA